MCPPARRAPCARKTIVAHRGASAYAPEHTLAAYELAIEQGADYVEQDLAVTRDGVLICLHDASLERTTDVEQLFPNRVITETIEGGPRKAWLANDFTLAEIKTLDAGSWFDAKFAGERVPTFDEAVALIRGRAGLYPELKTPEIYEGRDVDFVALVEAGARPARAARAKGRPGDARDPADVRGVHRAGRWRSSTIGLPVVLLLDEAPAGWDARAMVSAWKGVVHRLRPGQAHRGGAIPTS